MKRIMIIQIPLLKLLLKGLNVFDYLMANIDKTTYLAYVDAIMDIV